MEPTKTGIGVGAFVTATLINVVPNALAEVLAIDLDVSALIMLLSPFFAGLVGGRGGRRPVFQSAAACTVGALAWLVVGGMLTGEPPVGEDTLVPSVFLVGYSTAAGGFGAWVASRVRPTIEGQPPA